ncbi:MAG: hypothetical protein KOO62_05250 [candidate division Zixibacteria bacterium]|nr:hypothetical protein [candidate division Zixibacteria bacterium]
MRNVGLLISRLIGGFTIMLLLTDDAHAYVDPSTGSYLIQILLAGLLGALFTLKIYWKRVSLFIATLFSRSKRDDDTTS